MEDPFRILGLPRQFDLTPAEVTTAHLRAVSRLHPDRATDEVQRVQMVQEAAAVGAAAGYVGGKVAPLLDKMGASKLAKFVGTAGAEGATMVRIGTAIFGTRQTG
jgi:hypothetical protein